MPKSSPKSSPQPAPKRNNDIMQFADLGMRLALSTAVFTYAGYRLDGWLSTAPWLLITFCFVGVTGGMVSVVSGVNRWQALEKAAAQKAAEKQGEDSKPADRQREGEHDRP